MQRHALPAPLPLPPPVAAAKPAHPTPHPSALGAPAREPHPHPTRAPPAAPTEAYKAQQEALGNIVPVTSKHKGRLQLTGARGRATESGERAPGAVGWHDRPGWWAGGHVQPTFPLSQRRCRHAQASAACIRLVAGRHLPSLSHCPPSLLRAQARRPLPAVPPPKPPPPRPATSRPPRSCATPCWQGTSARRERKVGGAGPSKP
jgi:hypothetical protein